MRYIPRHAEKVIEISNKTFKVVFLGGPRQVGKTTVLKRLAQKNKLNYLTLDDLNQRQLAKSDPALFLQQVKRPLIIDEIQYAPELFPQIKKLVDENKENGQFWLTGSQQFGLIKNIQETLAGRVAILNILGLCRREKNLRKINEKIFEQPRISKLFEEIFEGSFPVFQQRVSPDRDIYFNSYIQTYLDRDLVDLFGINKTSEFNRFLQVCAARTGQVLNHSDLARDSGISPTTAIEWLNILEGTSQIFLLRPYYPNITKRIIKAPKLYFIDTGLASYLTKWNTSENLQSGFMAGAMFETYIVGEIIKKYINRGKIPPVFYLRDKEGHEADLLIEDDGLNLVEIKLTASVKDADMKNLDYFSSKSDKFKSKTIVSLIESSITAGKSIKYIPYTSI